MAKEELYFIHRYDNTSIASWWFVVPIGKLGIRKPADVTALHLAEHTSNGTSAQRKALGRDVFSVGGSSFDGILTKQAVYFILPFFPNRAAAAKTVWERFLKQMTSILSDTDWLSYTKELEDELIDLTINQERADLLRRRLFPPGSTESLHSGGRANQISLVDREVNIRLRSQLKRFGSIWLFWPQNQPLPPFVNQPEGAFPNRPPHKPIQIKNRSAVCRHGSGVIMPPLSTRDVDRVLGLLDLAVSQLEVWQTVEIFIQAYQEATTIFFFGSKAFPIRHQVADWLKKAPRQLLEEFSEGCRQERQTDIEAGPRLVIEDWLHGFPKPRPFDWLVKELIKACSLD